MDRSRSKIIVDRIVRYENLLAELREIFTQLNIPFDGTLACRSEIGISRRPAAISGSVQRPTTANRRESIRKRN